MKKYIPLHVHSHYSLLDGLSKPQQIAERCNKIGVSSCALTDHGNISGTVKFHSTMKSAGIKPILGCELYISNNDASIKDSSNRDLSHLVILAKNYTGWQTMIKIISESNRSDLFYYKPRLDLDRLGKLLDGNIIGFAGHLGSVVANKIMTNDTINNDWENNAIPIIDKLQNIFGKDNFFLEAQLMDQEHNPIQKDVTDCIRKIAKQKKIKVVTQICPRCEQAIPVTEMDEHVRIELLDPKVHMLTSKSK